MYKAKQPRELDGIRSNRTKAQEKDKAREGISINGTVFRKGEHKLGNLQTTWWSAMIIHLQISICIRFNASAYIYLEDSTEDHALIIGS